MQGCLECVGPRGNTCNLDDVKDKEIDTIISNYDGCYERKESHYGKVKPTVDVDLGKMGPVKRAINWAGKFNIKVSSKGFVKGEFGGRQDETTQDGNICPKKRGGCQKKDENCIAAYYSPTVGASGKAMLKGWVGLSAELSAQTTYELSGCYEDARDTFCLPSELVLRLCLRSRGKYRLAEPGNITLKESSCEFVVRSRKSHSTHAQVSQCQILTVNPSSYRPYQTFLIENLKHCRQTQPSWT